MIRFGFLCASWCLIYRTLIYSMARCIVAATRNGERRILSGNSCHLGQCHGYTQSASTIRNKTNKRSIEKIQTCTHISEAKGILGSFALVSHYLRMVCVGISIRFIIVGVCSPYDVFVYAFRLLDGWAASSPVHPSPHFTISLGPISNKIYIYFDLFIYLSHPIFIICVCFRTQQ